ncbi:ABC transporter ATP-binding protein [Sphingobacterium arenae]|uniref:ABC transporter ATP-binding protein n=1 Tax=Sphingobacterium arenae TaxID=1280598 RepID=A0ABR7Y6D1_9SPHI|nr:ATP-binding cassette domain-containing protein [Sphingobacterium arenae]MBD1426865.1 ABC transporter ATP-binding protein [Sphingobacterium arenae]
MLDIRHIVKQYSHHRALDDISLHVPKGSIFGLLGPNGAGKTSLIRIINQITAPDSGEIYFDGQLLHPKHIERIGYLPEERGLYKKMKIGEQMLYLAQLKGLSKGDATLRIRKWFEKLQIENWWNKKVEDLSKGMQQKVQFVATVVHEPDLIILDEPFSGFDPVNAQVIQEEILELNRKGATIIYSTHRMESVEQLCDYIALINKAKKVLDGPVREIKRSYQQQVYVIEFSVQHDGQVPNFSETSLFDVIEEKTAIDNHEVTIRLKNDSTLNNILLFLINQVDIRQIREVVPSMHDIFIDHVTESSTSKFPHYE